MRMGVISLALVSALSGACADDVNVMSMEGIDVPPYDDDDQDAGGQNPGQPPVQSPDADTPFVPQDAGGFQPTWPEDTDAGQDEAPTTPGPGSSDPMIPEPSMACPTFRSGRATIMGLSVEIYAGPRSSSGKGPLLFYWHGTGGQGSEANIRLPQSVRDEILAEGGMIVSPTDTTRMGTDATVVLGVWHTGDYAFADLMVACAVKEHNVDPRRIYSTGCSAGGLMSGMFAFGRSGYLAAAAPNSGGLAPTIPTMLQNPDYVPAVMTMHGENDQVIVNFKDTSKTLNMSIKEKGGFTINCNHGGGHCGAPRELQEAAWQFMKDHPYGVDPEPYAAGLPSNFPSYCTIY